jgi:hypothetical protein
MFVQLRPKNLDRCGSHLEGLKTIQALLKRMNIAIVTLLREKIAAADSDYAAWNSSRWPKQHRAAVGALI